MLLRVSRPALLAIIAAASLCVVVTTPPIHGAEPAEATSPSAAKLPPFDVISIKPNNSAEHRAMVEFVPDGIHVVNISPVFLLRDAFRVNDDQLINLPGWAHSASYDIDAKVAPDDVPAVKNLAREQRAQMMLSIFTDRFHLA
jgi:hypothetical protein